MRWFIVLFLLILIIPVYAEDLEIKVSLDDVLYLGSMYKDLFKVTNLDHKTGITDNITVYVKYTVTNVKDDYFVLNELNYYKTSGTGFFKPEKVGGYVICGYILNSSVKDDNKENNKDCKNINVINTGNIKCNVSLWVYSTKQIYNNNEKVEFYNYISNDSFPFLIEYWIEDIFGDVVKERYNTSSLSKKQWTPKISQNEKAFLIKNKLHVLCDNSGDEDDERLIVVKGNEEETELNNYVKILDVSKLKVGETGNVKIEVVKGDTRKYAVKLGLGNSESKVYIYDKGNYTLLLPIIPKKDGKYDLILEGLGNKDKKEVEVEGKEISLEAHIDEKIVKEVCEEKENLLEKASPKEYGEKVNNLLTGDVIYESSDVKAEKLGIYIFVFVLILFMIYLIFKKAL